MSEVVPILMSEIVSILMSKIVSIVTDGNSFDFDTEFAPGKMYVYEYSARLLTGIPDLADQYSGFEMTADLVLQAQEAGKVAMKMTNVKVGHTNDHVPANYEEDIDMLHRWNKEYQRELTKPIVFKHTKGQVSELEADQSEQDWSLNVKKSILSLFNLNLTPSQVMQAQRGNLVPKTVSSEDLAYYGVYEQGMGGNCETTYEINHIPDPEDPNPERDFVLNVTKTRNYKNCRSEPTLVKDNFDQRGCPQICRKQQAFAAVQGYYPVAASGQEQPETKGCPCGQELDASPIEQYNSVKYNISQVGAVNVIEGIWSEGKVVYNTFGDKILVVTRQNVTLTKLTNGRQSSLAEISNPTTHRDLSYKMPRAQQQGQRRMTSELPYLALFGQQDVQELTQNLPRLLEALANEITSLEAGSSKDSMHRVVEVVNTLAALPADALEATFRQIAAPGKAQDASPKAKIIRKLYLDALALAGSNKAALLIKKLVISNQVSTDEAKDLIEAVPQNTYLPEVATIDAYLELAQHPRIQNRPVLQTSASIAFAKMVRGGCIKAQQAAGDLAQESGERNDSSSSEESQENMARRNSIEREDSNDEEKTESGNICSQRDLQRYVDAAAQILERADTFTKKVSAIETLAHIAVPEALKALEPYITGSASYNQAPGFQMEGNQDIDEERNFLRIGAVYATAHIAKEYPRQVLPLVLPVYRNVAEPYELRIAAFTIMMLSQPETHLLESIATELHRETNKQVASFVISAFDSIGNMTFPCVANLAKAAAKAAEFAPEQKQGMKYSKFVSKDYYDEEKEYGLRTIAEWIANNQSSVPRAAYFSVGQSDGPFHGELLEMGFSAKGLEKIAERIMGRNGIFATALENMNLKSEEQNASRNKRSTNSIEQAVEALKEKLDFQPRKGDEPKLNMFFKLFESTSVYALDEQQMNELVEEAEKTLRQWAIKLLNGYTGHFVKMMMPSSIYKIVPSEMGVPVVISHKHPIVLSIKINNAKLELSSHPKTPVPIAANISATIEPQVMYSSYTFMFAVSPANRVAYGTHVEKTTQASLPIEITVGHIRPKNLWTVSLVPKVPHEILYHKSEARTFISRTKIASAPTREWLGDSQTIKSVQAPFKVDKKIGQKKFGLGLRLQANTEDAWDRQMPWSSKTAEKKGLLAAAIEYFRNAGLQNRDAHINLETDSEEPTTGIDLTFRYKWVSDEETGSDKDDSDESSASNESDSDESDESSSSASSSSSESNTSESKSESHNHKNESKNHSKHASKHHLHNHRSSRSRSASDSSSSSSHSSSEESASSPESSAQSSSSESDSSSSSSSESDESISLEDAVTDFEEIMAMITGKNVEHNIKKIAQKLMKKTSRTWAWSWDENQDSESSQSQGSSSSESESDDSDSSSSDESESRSASSSSSESRSDRKNQSDRKNRSESRSAHQRQKGHYNKAEKKSLTIPAYRAHDIVMTITARGPRPSHLAINVVFVESFDKRTSWIKASGHVKTPRGMFKDTPTLFCADGVVAFPRIPGEFYYEQTQQQDAKAKYSAELGWGRQCQSGSKIQIKGQLEKTQDKVWKSEDFAHEGAAAAEEVQEWFKSQCQTDEAEGKTSSYACERAIIRQSYFNQLTMDIKYEHVAPELKQLAQKLDLALKYKYYDNVKINQRKEKDEKSKTQEIRLVAHYSNKLPQMPMLNIKIQKPSEYIKIEKVFAPYVRPPSTIIPLKELYKYTLAGQRMTRECFDTFDTLIRT